MSKKLHLICNAHLDPVWQWEWEEGAAEALSTFRIAADFCDEYDNFVFCHNEALLYQWIEEYDMPLFEKIRRLVKEGKWHIMGGWHLQPDCNMPSGEFFVRQIMSGRKYFLEKFGVVPKVAINVDPFGHTRGLVQILNKTGYEGYMFMRPGNGDKWIKLPADEFKWVGYDDSEITAVRHGSYNSRKGNAIGKVKGFFDRCPEDDFVLCLWGIGNHGGGPSKKDIDDINAFAKEMKEQGGHEIIHSTPEMFIDELNKSDRVLPKVERSLNPWSTGCYTSQVRIKQQYRACENLFTLTEVMCSQASLNGLMEYPAEKFAEALYDILTVQFHDSIPGSSIQPVEEMALRMLDHAKEILTRLKAKAFFALASGQKKADEDKIPVFAYNPYPYEISGDFTAEFMLWDQNWNEEFLHPRLYNDDGVVVPSQCEKENSTIPLEWRKRVTFNATLKPMSLNRFDCGFDIIPKKPVPVCDGNDTHFVYDNGTLHVEINKNTGLIDSYRKNGTEYVNPGAFVLDVYQDNYDPWGMLYTSYTDKIGSFKLASKKETQRFCCLDNEIDSVHVIESGDVRTVIEAVFCYEDSRALVKYFLSQKDGLKIDIRVVWTEKQKMIKLGIPTSFGADKCIGEHAYGREELFCDLTENVSQQYLAATDGKKALAVANNGVYGSSFDGEKGILNITLLRSASYTAHPLDNRVTMPQDRYLPYIEQGERDFSFKFDIGEADCIFDNFPRKAQQFNMQPVVLSFYPTGVGEKPVSPLKLEGEVIQCTAFKMAEVGEGYIVRLFNPTAEKRSACLEFMGKTVNIDFGKYEIKTFRANEEGITESDLLENLLD